MLAWVQISSSPVVAFGEQIGVIAVTITIFLLGHLIWASHEGYMRQGIRLLWGGFVLVGAALTLPWLTETVNVAALPGVSPLEAAETPKLSITFFGPQSLGGRAGSAGLLLICALGLAVRRLGVGRVLFAGGAVVVGAITARVAWVSVGNLHEAMTGVRAVDAVIPNTPADAEAIRRELARLVQSGIVSLSSGYGPWILLAGGILAVCGGLACAVAIVLRGRSPARPARLTSSPPESFSGLGRPRPAPIPPSASSVPAPPPPVPVSPSDHWSHTGSESGEGRVPLAAGWAAGPVVRERRRPRR